jgi:protein involved in polysaccharide export with SLBB domain
MGPYRIGPADVLVVAITGRDVDAPLSQLQVRVDEVGEVDLPIVGGVKVAQMTLKEADDAIRTALVPQVFADAVVYVETTVPDTTTVLVRGAVQFPGMVQLRRTERNLVFAVVNAGGASSGASGQVSLTRIRRSMETINLDLTKAEDLQKALGLDPLESGDIVNVHAAFPNTIFVGGLLNAPHPLEFAAGVQVNILQVLAATGGPRTDVTPTEVTLIRRMPDGTDAHVKLDLKRIWDGRDPNIMLAAGDILWVPETLGTKIEEFINQNIFMRAGVSATYTVSGVEYMNRAGQQSGQFGNSNNTQNSFDPLGFLGRNAALNTLTNMPPVIP